MFRQSSIAVMEALAMHHFSGMSIILLAVALSSPARGDDPFPVFVRPTLREHCLKCHSTQQKKGDLDLERFTSAELVMKQPKTWEAVLEKLANSEMPPEGERQLPAGQKTKLAAWVRATLDQAALRSAGDPGAVVLRRLSNMEYTYTLRDLTGVESLDPAKEFPADGAAGEGFTNAGAALVMSPALLTKYLDAAKAIADHVVLVPDGIRFSPGISPRDWTDESMAKIRSFYARYCEAAGATAVNLQGIQFETNAGGRLPLKKYLAALVDERSALTGAKKSIAAVALERGLNAKYLGLLWKMLSDNHGKKSSLVLDSIRAKWRAGTLAAEDIEAWQKALWRFASVGQIGKRDGPKAWQEPVTPLVTKNEMRLKLPAPAKGGDVVFYLAAGDAGDGNENDFALWENPRLVAPGRADRPLRDLNAVFTPTVKFGKHPRGGDVAPNSLCVQAPSLIEVRLPAKLAAGAEFIVTGRLDPVSGKEGSVQLEVLATRPQDSPGLAASKAKTFSVNGLWSSNNLRTVYGSPVIVNEESRARKRFEAAFDDFRQLFPVALCYTKIVPVDEVITLTLLYREDEPLQRLMLDDADKAALDRTWDELLFVNETPLKEVDAFEQLYQFATQDADPTVLAPMREPIKRAAAAFRKRLLEVEPKQVQAVLDFAARAWRRPLTNAERDELRSLYQKLRTQKLPHAKAIRMLVARVLVAPAFLYRGEKAGPGPKPLPVNDWELATRLSYFLWSTAPDDELRAIAASGALHEPIVLAAEARRMLKDAKVRRLATEFGCQWLHVRDLETLDEKSERHFPTFNALKGAMQEEAVRFFMDLFQADRSALSLLDADYSFMNGPLARHYGIELKSDEWQRVDGLHARGRGGILGFAGTLARQSGASRTSPILRGNWLSDVVLGDKLPRPPKGVPVLPEEAPNGLTERQLVERHDVDPNCARCHQRIDPFGFALEGFDAIGRARVKDTANLPINTAAKLPDGTQIQGFEGLRSYLLDQRRDDFLRQFCRKLLGYALGRSVQLSDKPLLDSMLAQLKVNEYKVGTAVEMVIKSPQFRDVRGREFGDP
jgi:hypothetical protein